MAYQRTRHRFHAVGDDEPTCTTVNAFTGAVIGSGLPCEQAQPATTDSFVNTVESLWQGTGFAATPYDPSLPDCSTAQVGQKCNSVTAAQAAANASSSSTTRMLLLGGVALLGAYLLLGGKKGSRR